MLQLDLQFLPTPGAAPLDVAIVIDALRMTTTASTLFHAGLSELAVIATVDDARAAAGNGTLLLGERHGVALPGFDGGNSPLEYESRDLRGRTAILCTTNGSRAVESAARARHLLLGSIVNASAVATRAVALAQERITLVCAGTEDHVSLDDALAGACIARAILATEPEAAVDDACRIALALLDSVPDLESGLLQAKHGRTLQRLGFDADLAYAARLDSVDTVPERHANRPSRFRIPTPTDT